MLKNLFCHYSSRQINLSVYSQKTFIAESMQVRPWSYFQFELISYFKLANDKHSTLFYLTLSDEEVKPENIGPRHQCCKSYFVTNAPDT